jgi:hypothetical protein
MLFCDLHQPPDALQEPGVLHQRYIAHFFQIIYWFRSERVMLVAARVCRPAPQYVAKVNILNLPAELEWLSGSFVTFEIVAAVRRRPHIYHTLNTMVGENSWINLSSLWLLCLIAYRIISYPNIY